MTLTWEEDDPARPDGAGARSVARSRMFTRFITSSVPGKTYRAVDIRRCPGHPEIGALHA